MSIDNYWTDFGYWRRYLTAVYNSIETGEDNKRFGSRKGFIVEKVAGTESRLDFVKDYLKVAKLQKSGKVSELTVDDSWTPSIVNSDSKLCVNRIILSAFKARNGLLVLNVSNIKFFEYCWFHIKELAKQQRELVACGPFDENSGFFDVDETLEEIEHLAMIGCSEREIDEFADESVSKAQKKGLIPSRFEFKGYVLLVLDGLDWKTVCEHSNRFQPDWFDAAMTFYSMIDF
ncbi:MAG: hypothetical protein MJZ07_07210 [Bacteroidales bacterium]|nr:hypothetical protein [Bacteroidales bacterium]